MPEYRLLLLSTLMPVAILSVEYEFVDGPKSLLGEAGGEDVGDEGV